MSKTQDKRLKTKMEHAEYLWQQAQLKAAMAKTELDLAFEVVKDLNQEMTPEQMQQVEEQLKVQYKAIEDFLMRAKDEYLNRMGVQAE